MPKLIDCEQGSDEWLECRVGRITASRMADVMAYLKSGKGEMQCRADYRLDLVAERLTGRAEDHFVTKEMKRGTEEEPYARFAYEKERDVMVDQIGFAIHPTINSSGASPDALVGSDGGLEIKNPKTTTHLAWMMAGVVPIVHRPQMYWNMVCFERTWWDFMSFDRRIPDERLQKFIVRLPYDQAIVEEMEREVLKFDAEIEEVIEKLRGDRI